MISISALSFFIHGCLSDKNHDTNYNERFIKNLEEVETVYKVNPVSESMIGSSMVELFDDCKTMTVFDAFSKEILMTNDSGEILDKAAGEGRGPGELNMPSHFRKFEDSIYILDPTYYRISIYKIRERELTFHTSLSYKDPSDHFMTSFYRSKAGEDFGLYNVSQGFFTLDNEYRLYRLDGSLSPKDELLVLPGEDRQMVESPDFTMYVPHQYLPRPYWYVDNNWFYYAKSDDSTIFRYHLKTGEKEEIIFLNMEKRTNSPTYADLVIQEYSENEENAEYWEALREIEDLPLFTSLLVKDPFIYLTLLPTPGSEGITLLLDMDKQETRYFRTPQEFIPRAVCGNSVYGIDFRVGNTQQVGKVQLIK